MICQTAFFVVELTELFDVLLMLTAAPVLREGDSGLKFRDLVVEFSRWVLGPRSSPQWIIDTPLLAGEK